MSIPQLGYTRVGSLGVCKSGQDSASGIKSRIDSRQSIIDQEGGYQTTEELSIRHVARKTPGLEYHRNITEIPHRPGASPGRSVPCVNYSVAGVLGCRLRDKILVNGNIRYEK